MPLAEPRGRPSSEADLSDPSQYDIERNGLLLIEAMRARLGTAWPTPIADRRIADAVRIVGWIDQAEVTLMDVTERKL